MLDKVSSLDEAKLKALGAILTALKTGTSIASAWAAIPGNSCELSYFAGIDARNPSGTVGNLDTVLYKTGATTIVTQELTYDILDNVVKVEGI